MKLQVTNGTGNNIHLVIKYVEAARTLHLELDVPQEREIVIPTRILNLWVLTRHDLEPTHITEEGPNTRTFEPINSSISVVAIENSAD